MSRVVISKYVKWISTKITPLVNTELKDEIINIILQYFEEENKLKWIQCSDALPYLDGKTSYLVKDMKQNIYMAILYKETNKFDWYEGREYWVTPHGHRFLFDEITHWMSLSLIFEGLTGE